LTAPGEKLRVAICEDHELFRRGVFEILSLARGIEVVGEAVTREEAVGKVTPSRGVGRRSMRERAEMLGGSVRVDSKSGADTRVEMRVPFDGYP
jgi:hypothetical protein